MKKPTERLQFAKKSIVQIVVKIQEESGKQEGTCKKNAPSKKKSVMSERFVEFAVTSVKLHDHQAIIAWFHIHVLQT